MKRNILTKPFLIIFLISIITLSLTLTGCSEEESFHTIYLNDAFSVVPYISIFSTTKDFDSYKTNVTKEANDCLQALDDKFNVNKDNSVITNVNNNAYNNNVEIDYEFYYILDYALNINKTVSDKYDPTIYSLSKLWDFKNQYYTGKNTGTIPSQIDIENTKTLVDASKVILTKDNDKYYVKFEEINAKIDLGSIVKGYAADCLVKILKQNDVKKAIINIGGNIITFGDKTYTVGITTPFNEEYNQDCNIVGILSIDSKESTFVTTGVYERYIKTIDNKMYHHILDKETGYPIDNDLYSVTIVIHNNSDIDKDISMQADSLSTSIFCLGLTDGLNYCINNNIEAVFITRNKEIILTDGLKDIFDFNSDLTEYGYKVKE